MEYWSVGVFGRKEDWSTRIVESAAPKNFFVTILHFLRHSITPILHYSNTPILPYSTSSPIPTCYQFSF